MKNKLHVYCNECATPDCENCNHNMDSLHQKGLSFILKNISNTNYKLDISWCKNTNREYVDPYMYKITLTHNHETEYQTWHYTYREIQISVEFLCYYLHSIGVLEEFDWGD